jgi:hypothetical protein
MAASATPTFVSKKKWRQNEKKTSFAETLVAMV